MKAIHITLLFCVLSGFTNPLYAQSETVKLPDTGEKFLLNTGWYARRANELITDGNHLSASPFSPEGWIKAKVPGTVLTTMLANSLFPAPEFSLNNHLIPDIYNAGKDFYTFWFVKPFEIEGLDRSRQIWLNFRGINYKADIFLNGKRINTDTHEGMFLRKSFNITGHLNEKGTNILAVIVYPPDYPGNANGGQGGDAQIARNVTMQFTPGWDWIQPVRDRNTGIWDEVSITVSGQVKVQHPYVRTKVPGVRNPGGNQENAVIKTSVELENISGSPQKGLLICETNRNRLTQTVTLNAGEKRVISLEDLSIADPRLWWPNGIGEQHLYDMQIAFEIDNRISDSETLRYGIREITSEKDPATGGRKFYVNGQPVYMTGGNYIASDWLLRLSPERYRAEVRFHAEMNIRMIRVWGGALLERPEFYDACDEYGMLVFQDLWGSGDCNGAWEDATKLHSRERRWEYPDNHHLFLTSAEDQIKMIRNHPSLCLWCGANEWPLAADIDECLKKDIFPRLDPERLFAGYSTDTVFTRNTIGGVGDGPYGIQEPEWFFTFRSTPFNPEAGSVGSPEVESMREMMTREELAEVPQEGRAANPAWRYHKDLGYRDHLERYGKVTDIETYCKYAQAVNYDQYRSFMEGWASHMWEWYTGILIWKTQNPWTSLRGQMYDWFLDVNASLYGTRKGCEPLHPQYNRVTRQVELVNTALGSHQVTVKAVMYDSGGNVIWNNETQTAISANRVLRLYDVPLPQGITDVYFLKLMLLESGEVLTDNIYWLTAAEKDYTSLARLPKAATEVKVSVDRKGEKYSGKISLKSNGHISFFNRIKVFDKTTGKRILPVHYTDNYITLMPGDRREVEIEFLSGLTKDQIEIVVESWTDDRKSYPL
ncbi:MAG: beta-glycosidase [Tannerella sp.]|nr:beta-glycosidase [Tannerella sp.]